MTDRKVILRSLLIPVSLSLLAILRYGDIDSGVILFLVLLFALWGGGLFVGLLLYAFLYKHKKPNPWNYLFGEIIVFGGFFSILIIGSIQRARKYRAAGLTNAQYNHSMVDSNGNNIRSAQFSKKPYVQIAFKKLESVFPDPENFLLRSWLTDSRDTIISSYPQEIRFVYFVYTLQDKTEDITKISVVDTVATVIAMNGGATLFQEYRSIREKNQRRIKEIMDSAQEALKKLPDTLTNKKEAQRLLDKVMK